MAGIYRQRPACAGHLSAVPTAQVDADRHPEHTVFYRVFFYYFERFLREYDNRFEKEYGYFPRIHVLITEGGTAPDGAFRHVLRFHEEALQEIFTHEVFSLLLRKKLIGLTGGTFGFRPWEQIFYGEFDGRRRKRVLVKIIGE